ncbi:hypothetical protein CAPTEDRAFT_216067 [Capitella teleta]|uniref:Uncharacterized protein n=1 Tax=Capitella teleta TaxID=283909 RepID=R7U002_CAPTE|nr:hypothetical protein CAPTEDRAFT_216067 [Capitella teleta]|eukprot:ELT96530.1 hypothetical protein CAPTEDRAFT_216067 [Capitella teleta]
MVQRNEHNSETDIFSERFVKNKIIDLVECSFRDKRKRVRMEVEMKEIDIEMEFEHSLHLAEALTDPLVQLRGETEVIFQDYKHSKHHKKFKDYVSAAREKKKVPGCERFILRANYIMKNFKAYYAVKGEEIPKDFKEQMGGVDPSAPIELLLPTLTFGHIVVPERFSSDVWKWDTAKDERNYLKLHESCKTKILELITSEWRIDLPNVIFSFSGGNARDIPEDIQKKFGVNLYNFCKSVGVWMVTDGMHSGISRFLGRVFNTDLVPSAEEINLKSQRDVNFFGLSDWDDLEDPKLLHGVSLLREYSSKYFYSHELQMADEEIPSMLNPFQNIYLLFQIQDDLMVDIRHEFLKQLKYCKVSQARSSISAERLLRTDSCDAGDAGSSCKEINLLARHMTQSKVIPNATFVIGGDSTTVRQVRLAVENEMSVIILHKTGQVATSLVEIYRKLEDLLPRSCIFQSDFTEKEDDLVSELLKDGKHQCLFDGVDPEVCIDDMKQIMKYRYFITILNFGKKRDSKFDNVIQALYKPFKRNQCISIALRTQRVMFLKNVFNREVDPEFDNGSSIATSTSLAELHAANLQYENANIFKVKHLVSASTPDLVLPLVGRIIYKLLGSRYGLLYQTETNLDDIWEQYFHLFLYCVMACKFEFAYYLLTLTRSPVGSALLAFNMLKSMSRMASRTLENEKASLLKTWSLRFENQAIKIVDEIYNRSRRRAYVTINRELPCTFGPYISPLSMAFDSRGMNFMQSSFCQTYLQRVWAKNMLLTQKDGLFMLVLAMLPILNIPFILISIKYEETVMPDDIEKIMKEEDNFGKGRLESSLVSTGSVGKSCPGSAKWFFNNVMWKIASFYTAPITKFNLSVISYCAFLSIMSYFFLCELDPFRSMGDICVAEWLCYIWVISLLIDEVANVAKMKATGPMHKLSKENLNSNIWTIAEKSALLLYRPLVYYKNRIWNVLFIAMLTLYFITTIVRFCIADENFQIVRILYGVSIIFFYYRTLRFLYVSKVIGPRIIAMGLMFVELMFFLGILLVFILGFGVAFQGLLHPHQEPSFNVLAGILWRPYWSMFGQLYIDEGDVSGMGFDVGNTSCVEIASQDSHSHLECYSYMPIVLMAIYVFISNILLLNLLIAIFGNTLNKIEDSSALHWAFKQYSVVFESYYKTWLPPPLNMLCHLCTFLHWVFMWCVRCLKKEKADEKFLNDHFHMKSILEDKSTEFDQAQKEAFAYICNLEDMASKAK